MLESKRKQTLVGVVALIAGVGTLVAFLHAYGAPGGAAAVADSLRCPSQYATGEEAIAAFETFSNNYYAAHTSATTGDMLQARLDFYVAHHCTEELKSYQQAVAGQADKATMDMIDRAIQEAYKN